MTINRLVAAAFTALTLLSFTFLATADATTSEPPPWYDEPAVCNSPVDQQFSRPATCVETASGATFALHGYTCALGLSNARIAGQHHTSYPLNYNTAIANPNDLIDKSLAWSDYCVPVIVPVECPFGFVDIDPRPGFLDCARPVVNPTPSVVCPDGTPPTAVTSTGAIVCGTAPPPVAFTG